MLDKEEKRKFPIVCPHCKNNVVLGDCGWLGVFDDLSQFGKSVIHCGNCKNMFLIREEDEDGPFITK